VSRILDKIADYVNPKTGLSFTKIPESIIKRNKWQILSMIGAILHGKKSPYFRWIMDRVYPKDSSNTRELACALSTLSMLYDYDDFMFAAHSGHSSVITPLAFSGKYGIDGQNFITLQTIGNEICGRLGASIFLGTHNGQMWTPVHQITAASQLARMRSADMKDDEVKDMIKSCITLALAYPVYGMLDTFFGSSAKCMTASSPLDIGIKSGLAGDTGIGGADPFEDYGSFYQTFSYLPLLTVWDSLGIDFLSRTLSFKKFPGCAYIAAPVQACEEIFSQMNSAGSDTDGIEFVEIYCNILSKKMDDLSGPYLKGRNSTLTTLNFSLPINCSLMLHDGVLMPESFSKASLSRDAVWSLAERTKVYHDPKASLQMLKHSSPIPDTTSLLLKHPFKLLPFYKKYGGLKDLASMPVDIKRSRMLKKEFPESRPNLINDGEYRFYNGATVVVRLRDGSAICRHVGMPEGFVGTPESIVEEMLAAKLRNAAGEKEATSILETVNNLERLDSAGVHGLLKQVMAIIERDIDTK
jgi:2-methylcitrate dehydratase PrpD